MRFCSSLTRQATPFLFLLLAIIAQPLRADSDERALAVAERAMKAMGGEEAWSSTRFLLFTFAVQDGEKVLVERTHFWDKRDHRHRVQGTTREGESFVVIENIETKTGKAWLDGEPLEGDQLGEWLKRAWSMWVNDTYWLLMPYKLTDPGVNLSWEGEETIDGTTYDELHLSFENVGLTPGDQYWAWFNRETGLMDRWAYILEGQEPPAKAFEWKPWRPFGNIMLATARVPAEGTRRIVFRDLAVPHSLPESIFTSLEAPEVTTLVIRATSRDAKIIGTHVGGATIDVYNAGTNELLAAGRQMGGTGSTDAIIREPHARHGTVYDTADAASFLATILLDETTMVRIEAEGPFDFPEAGGKASKTLLVVPGKDVRGEGILLEVHGFIVEILDAEVRPGSETGERLWVRARLRMT